MEIVKSESPKLPGGRWQVCRAQRQPPAASEPAAAEPAPDSWASWSDVPEMPRIGTGPFSLPVDEDAARPADWQSELSGLATSLRCLPHE